MSHLDPEKLHVEIAKNLLDPHPLLPRQYTLTHSDVTGDLYLRIGRDYDVDALSGWYIHLMRDEVLAEWLLEDSPSLHLHLHVSGGLVFGPAKWRESIFKQHLPLVLEAVVYGDRQFLQAHLPFVQAPINVHFHAKQADLDHAEEWGIVNDYLHPIQTDID